MTCIDSQRMYTVEEQEARQREERRKAEYWTPQGQTGGANSMGIRPPTAIELQNMRVDRILRRLDYHPPNEFTIPKYQALRDAAKSFVTTMVRNCPESADTESAITMVEHALMMANKAIANG